VTSGSSMTLRIPADLAFLSVARVFGGSVAAAFDLDQERTEDLRLALSEICAAVTEDAGAVAGTIDIEVSWDDAALSFSCRPVPLERSGPRWGLIEALMPDLREDSSPPSLSFSLQR
jgi:hypothetical protein